MVSYPKGASPYATRLLSDVEMDQEIALAIRRMELERRQPRNKYSKAKLKRIFSSWHVYLVTILYMCASLRRDIAARH